MKRVAGRAQKWLRLLAFEILILALSGAAFIYWKSAHASDREPRQELISLEIIGHSGQLQIEWNPSARAVRNATDGRIEILDGIESQSVTLTTAMLTQGRFSYVPATDDVRVRVVLRDDSGHKTQESARFLGGLPIQRVHPQNDGQELELEVNRLREINASQTQRIHDLERSLQVLEAKLGIREP